MESSWCEKTAPERDFSRMIPRKFPPASQIRASPSMGLRSHWSTPPTVTKCSPSEEYSVLTSRHPCSSFLSSRTTPSSIDHNFAVESRETETKEFVRGAVAIHETARSCAFSWNAISSDSERLSGPVAVALRG